MKEIRNINPTQARDELLERKADPAVETRLLELLAGIEVPTEIKVQPSLMMSPYLATPNRGVRAALRYNVEYGSPLSPVILTYEAVDFTDTNPEKAATVRPPIVRLNRGRKGLAAIQEKPKITQNPERMPIGDIGTMYEDLLTGEMLTLAEYYRRLAEALLPSVPRVDVSGMLDAMTEGEPGSTPAEKYYTKVSALSQFYGVGLNVGGNEDEGFYNRVVRPSVIRASGILGVEPISLVAPSNMPTGKAARAILIGSRSMQCLEDELKMRRTV